MTTNYRRLLQTNGRNAALALPVSGIAQRVSTPIAATIRWCYLLFIGSFVFEYVQVFGSTDIFTGTKFLGIATAGLALLQARVCYDRPPRRSGAFWRFSSSTS